MAWGRFGWLIGCELGLLGWAGVCVCVCVRVCVRVRSVYRAEKAREKSHQLQAKSAVTTRSHNPNHS